MRLDNLALEKNKQIKVLYLSTLVLLLPIFAGIYFLYTEDSKNQEALIQPEAPERFPVSLQSVQTNAHSAIVVSFNTNEVIYQKNSDKTLPLASLTKLITAKVAQKEISKETVSVEKMQELSEYGDARLSENQIWNKKELIGYTLVTSSNDGAHTLATNSKNAFSFINNMNTLAASIGLVNTRFYNETGLDDDPNGIIGSKGTAQDISKLLSYLVKTDLALYEKTKHGTITVSTPNGDEVATNTNDIVEQIPGLLISKTGYTDLAGGNLAVVADMGLNEPVAFVVLKSSREERFDDVLKLQEEYFAQARQRMR
jgi:D-alanyl-D-alanine carboxypeptidase